MRESLGDPSEEVELQKGVEAINSYIKTRDIASLTSTIGACSRAVLRDQQALTLGGKVLLPQSQAERLFAPLDDEDQEKVLDEEGWAYNPKTRALQEQASRASERKRQDIAPTVRLLLRIDLLTKSGTSQTSKKSA